MKRGIKGIVWEGQLEIGGNSNWKSVVVKRLNEGPGEKAPTFASLLGPISHVSLAFL